MPTSWDEVVKNKIKERNEEDKKEPTGFPPVADVDLNVTTLKNVRREMADIYRLSKLGAIHPKVGVELTLILKEIGKLLIDERDNRYKQRLNHLWAVYQKQLGSKKALPSDTVAVIDVTPTVSVNNSVINTSTDAAGEQILDQDKKE